MTDEQQQEANGTAAETETDLMEEMLNQARCAPEDEGYEVVREGIQAFITEMLAPRHRGERIDRAAVDAMISEIDQRMAGQVNAILHHPDLQRLESSWRGLKYMVDNFEFRENIKLNILNCRKEELLEDFEDNPEVPKSALYQHVYSAEYGTFGGSPYGLMVADYDFDQGAQDIRLLQYCASVAAMAHAPFISNVGPKMFGCENFTEFSALRDLEALFEGPQYARWNGFRESEDARYVGLCAPRVLLRLPYGAETAPVKNFAFEEEVVGDHDAYLWGHTSAALACRIADSFAKFRWGPHIIGPQAGGAVEDLNLHVYQAMGEVQTKIPTEVQLTERRELELSEQGFIGLVFRKGSDNASFFSANSCQKPKFFGQSEEGRAAEANYRLGTQLPYLMIVTRIAHYLKVLQREQIGTSTTRDELENQLSKWVNQYVNTTETTNKTLRGRYPLKAASVIVEEVEGQPGWFRCRVEVVPHFKYMGADITLSLVGKLDRA
jgi:type VI secretion system protein ImpC